jgi:hypothetical protein
MVDHLSSVVGGCRAVSGWRAGSLCVLLGSLAHALLRLGRDVRSSHRVRRRLFFIDVRGSRAEQFAVQPDGCLAPSMC